MTEHDEFMDRLVGAMDVPKDLPLGGGHWGTWNAGPIRGDQWQKSVTKTAEQVARSRVSLVRKVAEATRAHSAYGAADNTHLLHILEMVCIEMAAKMVVPDEALADPGPQDAP